MHSKTVKFIMQLRHATQGRTTTQTSKVSIKYQTNKMMMMMIQISDNQPA